MFIADMIKSKEDALMITAFIGAILAITALYKGVIRPGIKMVRKVNHSIEVVWRISQEFQVNGGGSMKDALNRLETTTNALFQRQLAMANAFDIGMFETDVRGETTWVNKKWEQMTGLSKDNAKGYGWLITVQEDDRDCVYKEWQEAVKQQRVFALDYVFEREDGKKLPVYVVAMPMRDSIGRVLGWFGVVQEVKPSGQAS